MAFDLPYFEQEGFEADDIIGTLAAKGSEAGWEAVSYTHLDVYKRQGSAPVFVCLGMKVQAGKRELIIETVIENGETLVAARPVLEAFNLPVSWDPQRREVVSGPAVLPAYVKAGQSFVHLGDLEKQLGIRSHWYEPEQMLKLSVWLIRMEKLEMCIRDRVHGRRPSSRIFCVLKEWRYNA